LGHSQSQGPVQSLRDKCGCTSLLLLIAGAHHLYHHLPIPVKAAARAAEVRGMGSKHGNVSMCAKAVRGAGLHTDCIRQCLNDETK
jgi:hypothetical protein